MNREKKGKEDNKEELNIKLCLEVLSLVFVLSLISIVLLYSHFEMGVNSYWNDREEAVQVFNENLVDKYLNVEQIQDPVYDIDKLKKEYIDTKGEIDIFSTLFELYRD